MAIAGGEQLEREFVCCGAYGEKPLPSVAYLEEYIVAITTTDKGGEEKGVEKILECPVLLYKNGKWLCDGKIYRRMSGTPDLEVFRSLLPCIWMNKPRAVMP